jgi:hypothetical protein
MLACFHISIFPVSLFLLTFPNHTHTHTQDAHTDKHTHTHTQTHTHHYHFPCLLSAFVFLVTLLIILLLGSSLCPCDARCIFTYSRFLLSFSVLHSLLLPIDFPFFSIAPPLPLLVVFLLWMVYSFATYIIRV